METAEVIDAGSSESDFFCQQRRKAEYNAKYNSNQSHLKILKAGIESALHLLALEH